MQSYAKEEREDIITVLKANPRTSVNGKPYIHVEDTNTNLYSIWEKSVKLPDLGGTYSIKYEVDGKYKNIVSMIKIDNGTSNQAEQKVNDRNVQIIRQHSQEMAIRTLELAQIKMNDIPTGSDLEEMKKMIFDLADAFDEDVKKTMAEPF